MKTRRLNCALLAASTLAVAMAAAPAAIAAPGACLKLPPEKVALGLYSVYEDVTGVLPQPAPGQPRRQPAATPEQLTNLFGRLRGQGWRRMENFANTWGLPIATYADVAAKAGLPAVASHDGLVVATWPAVLDRAVAMRQTFVGSGDFGQPGIDTLENTLATAANLDRMGAEARGRGLRFYVHTHQREFTNKFSYDLNGDGVAETVTVFDIVAARTRPENVAFQIDLGWAYAAFGPDAQPDLLATLRRYRNRIALLHIKDLGANRRPTDLGAGVVDLTALIEAAGPQIQYYIWEYDHPPKPMESAAIAYKHMTCS